MVYKVLTLSIQDFGSCVTFSAKSSSDKILTKMFCSRHVVISQILEKSKNCLFFVPEKTEKRLISFNKAIKTCKLRVHLLDLHL